MVFKSRGVRNKLVLDRNIRKESSGLNPGGFTGKGGAIRLMHAHMHAP
jgi:hypothetical protein